MTRTHLSFLFAGGLALGISCGDDGGGSDCQAGQAGCACVNGTCAVGLVCGPTGVCQFGGSTSDGTETGDETSGNSTSPTSGDPTTGDPTGDPTTSGDCQGEDGTLNCPCLGGNTCQGNLSCDSEQKCVCLGGTTACAPDHCADLMTDNDHCGACGEACQIGMWGMEVVGGCVAGACGPTWADCLDNTPALRCSDVCASQGQTCVQAGCAGFTGIGFSASDCSGPGTPLEPPCDYVWADELYLQCCCTQ